MQTSHSCRTTNRRRHLIWFKPTWSKWSWVSCGTWIFSIIWESSVSQNSSKMKNFSIGWSRTFSSAALKSNLQLTNSYKSCQFVCIEALPTISWSSSQLSWSPNWKTINHILQTQSKQFFLWRPFHQILSCCCRHCWTVSCLTCKRCIKIYYRHWSKNWACTKSARGHYTPFCASNLSSTSINSHSWRRQISCCI